AAFAALVLASQSDSGEHGRRPGAELLGRIRPFPPGAQRVVHVGSVDPVPAVLRSIHEQLIRRATTPFELAAHRDRLWVAHHHPATLARLRDEVKRNLRASERHVLAPERGETNVAVVASVAVPADPKQADVEQPDRHRERPIALAMALPIAGTE